MVIVSGLTKCCVAFATATVPSGAITYWYLPQSIKEVIKPYVAALKPEYAYFLVSKTHPIRGSFFYKPVAKNTDPQKPHYQQKLEQWKKSSTSFNQSRSDLFLESGKKTYKCAVPIPHPRGDQLKLFDNDCQIFRVKDDITKVSDVIGETTKDGNEIKEKLHVEYNKMYVLKINLNNLKLPLTEKLKVDTDLIVDIVDYDTDEIHHDKCILSFSIDNYWLPETKTWQGKVSSILVKSTTDVVAAGGSATTCTVPPSTTTYTCVGLYSSTRTPPSNPLADIKQLQPIECSTIKKDSQYVIYFLSNKFEESNFTDKTTEYQYSQCSAAGKPASLAKFTWEKSLVGYIDFATSNNNHLFILE